MHALLRKLVHKAMQLGSGHYLHVASSVEPRTDLRTLPAGELMA